MRGRVALTLPSHYPLRTSKIMLVNYTLWTPYKRLRKGTVTSQIIQIAIHSFNFCVIVLHHFNYKLLDISLRGRCAPFFPRESDVRAFIWLSTLSIYSSPIIIIFMFTEKHINLLLNLLFIYLLYIILLLLLFTLCTLSLILHAPYL